jgi:hypothetical protein
MTTNESMEKNYEALSLLDDKSFLGSFSQETIFYSTPFGNHKEGSNRLFALSAQDKTDAAYLPVFTSIERVKEFYDKAGRQGFLIMNNSFTSFLKTTRSMNVKDTPIKLGVVIDPGYLWNKYRCKRSGYSD